MTILERLREDSVFYIAREGAVFTFIEACDGYFCSHLTKEEVRQLSKELLELTDE